MYVFCFVLSVFRNHICWLIPSAAGVHVLVPRAVQRLLTTFAGLHGRFKGQHERKICRNDANARLFTLGADPKRRIPNACFQTRSTPGVGNPKMSGFYKGQLSNKVWLFFTRKHLNLHLFGFQEKFESNRPGKFESNGPFEPIDVAQ